VSTVPGPCAFHFADAACGFFDVATENARQIVPAGIEPLERCHGRSALAVIAFDFHGGHVGPYREVVLAILVPPVVEPGRQLPQSAMYPFLLGTSTARARTHGSEKYHLPHHVRDVDVSFESRSDRMNVNLFDEEPVLELEVTRVDGAPTAVVRRHYQVLSTHGPDTYVSDVWMSGHLMEHEEETGALRLHPHEFTRRLDLREVSPWPFREQWMTSGAETFHPPRRIGVSTSTRDV
jgi:hypothetical protein